MGNQKTTFVYRHINHRVKNKIVKSLKHSLRINDESFRELEWNKNLTPESAWVYSPTKEGFKLLSNISNDEKEHFINRITDNYFNDNVSSEDKNTLSKYKAKIKKKINSLDEEDPLVPILRSVIEGNNLDDYEDEINKLDNVKRKNQLIGMLNNYRDYYNLCSGATNKNSAKLHEAFFKFPIRNNVAINKEDAAKAIHSFYQKIVPDYPVELIVVHDDERLKEEDVGVGIHPHIFVSTKNQRTGKLDLLSELKHQVDLRLATQPVHFLRDRIDDETGEVVSEEVTIGSLKSSGRHYRGTQIFASVLQDMFCEHLSETFPSLDINFTADRQHRFGQRANKYMDSQQRKADRVYNLYGLAVAERDQLRVEIDDLKQNHRNIIKKISVAVIKVFRMSSAYIDAMRHKPESVKSDTKQRIINAVRDEIAIMSDDVRDELASSVSEVAEQKPKVDVDDIVDAIKRKNPKMR